MSFPIGEFSNGEYSVGERWRVFRWLVFLDPVAAHILMYFARLDKAFEEYLPGLHRV